MLRRSFPTSPDVLESYRSPFFEFGDDTFISRNFDVSVSPNVSKCLQMSPNPIWRHLETLCRKYGFFEKPDGGNRFILSEVSICNHVVRRNKPDCSRKLLFSRNIDFVSKCLQMSPNSGLGIEMFGDIWRHLATLWPPV